MENSYIKPNAEQSIEITIQQKKKWKEDAKNLN